MPDKIEKDHWHPGFLGAMEIEFRAYRPNLIFDDEHSLSKEPLKKDLLIIQKDKDVIITNQIAEYAWIVNEVREKNLTKDKEGARSAIDQAISLMPDDFVIKPFLAAHRAEVKGMLLTEYNEAEAMEKFERDGFFKALVTLVKKNLISIKDAAEQAGVSEKAFEQRMVMMSK